MLLVGPRKRFMLHEMLNLIKSPNRERCIALLNDNLSLWQEAKGSSHNHQAWVGGYLDHVAEVMMIATKLYDSLSAVRLLPFTLADAELVLFLHDLEKPWKKQHGPGWAKQERKSFRANKIEEYGIILTTEQQNALMYVEGEGDDYSPNKRVMNELAAFCHLCDVTSARIWHDQPRKN